MLTEKQGNLILLVYLLQLIGPIFGITAIFGMLINHAYYNRLNNNTARSHFKWQIGTFWIAFIFLTSVYATRFIPLKFALAIAFVWLYYRSIKGWRRMRQHRHAPVF